MICLSFFGDPVVLFIDEGKIIFPIIVPIKPSSPLGPTNQPQYIFIPHRWEPPSSFSVFYCGRSPKSETRGLPLTRLSPQQYAVERLWIQHVSELSISIFIPLSRSIVRLHMEYALESVHRLEARLLEGFRHMPMWGKRPSQLNLFLLECRRLRADLILALKIFKVLIDLSIPIHPNWAERAGYCKDQAIFDEGAVHFLCVTWNTGPATTAHYAIFRKKWAQTDRPWSLRYDRWQKEFSLWAIVRSNFQGALKSTNLQHWHRKIDKFNPHHICSLHDLIEIHPCSSWSGFDGGSVYKCLKFLFMRKFIGPKNPLVSAILCFCALVVKLK